jgi:transglutaminase-like putative cysteine protease
MLLRVVHRTTFRYAGEARDSFNEVRLCPITDRTQVCKRFNLKTDPEAPVRQYEDFYGNLVHYFDVSGGHDRLVVEADSVVETLPADADAVPEVPSSALSNSTERDMLAEFFNASPYVPLEVELWRFAQDALADGRGDIWNDVRRLGRHVHRNFSYRPKTTGVHTRATDALALRQGVCQDFAHVLLGLGRSVGLAVRYVSGYFLNPHRRPGESEASHAWIEAYVPGRGWIGYDPTHDRPADERYVKIATGRDYSDIRPISGTYRGATTSELKVVVRVRQVQPRAAAV